MTKSAFMLGLVLVLLSPVSRTQADDLQISGVLPAAPAEMQEPAKEDACDCCQKCKDAKSAIQSKEKEGAAVKDPCKECCDRCGKVPQSAPQDIPPEIVNKPVPPEVKDKHQR